MSNWTPSIVPPADDQTVYLVLNDFGKRGRSYLETDEETADLETVITGMIAGEYSSPARIVAFNTADGLVARCFRGRGRRNSTAL